MYGELIKEIVNLEVLTNSLKEIMENFSVNSAIMIIMMFFCVVGGVDKIRGNKHGYGEKFDEAFATSLWSTYCQLSRKVRECWF